MTPEGPNIELNKEQMEETMIDTAFKDLLDCYLASKHRKKVEIITKAFNFARQAHKGVKRHSGEPYIMHPLAVAKIVCSEIGLGSTSICAALLHDVVEDTDYTVEDIQNLFGDKIAQIVDGLTKIAGGVFGQQASEQTENFKKLLLTMSDDIRVILIKIADRLHNMRTLQFMPPNKQYKIAGETLYIYAPIAYRLGLNKIKNELEDLSFRYEHPADYEHIEELIAASQVERDQLFDEFTAPIRKALDEMGFTYQIQARIKSPYSIWKKMQSRQVSFEDIYDLLAVRIVFKPRPGEDEENECFNIYVAISKLYRNHPDRLRDWVNHPRANGYQALHVTMMSDMGKWVEVQIRSERMHEVAEQGVAAHWKYKEGETVPEHEEDKELESWLHAIKEILEDPQPDAIDFLDTIKLNLFATEIFVFTPKGEIKTMPQGCTALDFAYSIHTFLGSHCIGAKVNHKLVPLSQVLQSGDQIEILTSKSQYVHPEWLDIATTAKAKAKIQATLRREQRISQKEGEEILNEFLKKEDINISSINLERLWRAHDMSSREELFTAIGEKRIILGDPDKYTLTGTKKRSALSFFSFGNKDKDKKSEKAPEPEKTPAKEIDTKKPLDLNEQTLQKDYKIAECCHPIPGDEVLGFIDDNGQIVIHKRKCPVTDRLKAAYGNRILSANWNLQKPLYFLVTLNLSGLDSIGLLNKITGIISEQMNVNIQKINIECKEEIFEGKISLNVHDVNDVKIICNKLKKIKGITTIVRSDE